MRCNPRRTDVFGVPGPILAEPRKPMLIRALAELHFLPGPIISLQKKKN